MAAFTRKIQIDMDWIDTSTFEVRGTLHDNVHSLSALLRVGFPDFTIQGATGSITRMPYPGFCQGATGVLSGLIGQRIGRGFRKRVAEVLGGAESCNHLHTLVNDMGASAFQMNYVAAKQRSGAQLIMTDRQDDHSRRRQMVLDWMPQLRNSCYVFSEANDKLFEPCDSAEGADDSGGDTVSADSNQELTDGKIL
jgi:hypothetical protein